MKLEVKFVKMVTARELDPEFVPTLGLGWKTKPEKEDQSFTPPVHFDIGSDDPETPQWTSPFQNNRKHAADISTMSQLVDVPTKSQCITIDTATAGQDVTKRANQHATRSGSEMCGARKDSDHKQWTSPLLVLNQPGVTHRSVSSAYMMTATSTSSSTATEQQKHAADISTTS